MNLSMLSISTAGIVFSVLGGIVLISAILFMIIVPFKAWLVAIFAGAYVPSYKLLALKARKIDALMLVEAYIQSQKNGFGFSFSELEGYYLSGGNCKALLSALYKAKNSNIALDAEKAKAIDLAGLDLMAIVDSAVKSKNITIENVSALTQDSFEVIVQVKASIKANLNMALNGNDENALRDKISSFIIGKIALSGNYKALLSRPQNLTSDWQKAKIDNDNFFQIVSLEIGKVEIGRDVGSEMAVKRAEKEKAYALINIEKEKNDEILRELQMKTAVEEKKAEVLSAEAEVPKAIADAIKEGRFSVMDYYKLMNLQADTALRRSILSDDKANKPKE